LHGLSKSGLDLKTKSFWGHYLAIAIKNSQCFAFIKSILNLGKNPTLVPIL
jgi:hypothetical protein